MSSVSAICNRALQELGASRIVNITDDTKNSRACNACYDTLRKSEIRKHPWRFAIARQVLAPSDTAPVFGAQYQFLLPAGCLKILKNRDPNLDWQVEGRMLLTSQSTVVNLRFLNDVQDPNLFDVNFCEMLSMKMAEAMCEELTQSNSKQANAMAKYKDAKDEAKKSNAFETIPVSGVESAWVLSRETGVNPE